LKIDLIKNYISKLKKEDIINYLKKENVQANNEEVDLIYSTIMNNYTNMENINFIEEITKFKDKLNNNLYNKIIEKYNEYKKFIE